MSNLARTTLDASEQQVRDAEKQRTDLRRMLDDLPRPLHAKLSRPASAQQASSAAPLTSSSRSSDGLQRDPPPTARPPPEPAAGTDVMYLKTILLQFLEQKDNKLRAQLVPVRGKLLKFDR